MDAADVLQQGVAWSHEMLDMVSSDLTAEQAAWQPPGTANSAGAQLAHAICVEDAVINMLLKQGQPLFATEWEGRTGISDPQFFATPEWARAVEVDLDALRAYSNAVSRSADAFLMGLTDDDLTQTFDLSMLGYGQKSLAWVVNVLMISHTNNMAGEISCLRGLQGAKGYRF